VKRNSTLICSASFLLLISAVLLGCGGTSSVPPGCTANCTLQKPEVLYATSLNKVSAFTINTNTGALSAPVVMPGLNDAIGTTASPTANLLFVSDFTSDEIHTYSIDTSSGSPALAGGSLLTLGTTPGASGLVTDPAGKFLYVADANADAVHVLAIGASGSLAPVSGSPFPASNTPLHVAVDPSGKFLYASNSNDASGGISAYTIVAATGNLVPVSGSPFTTQAGFGGPGPLAVHTSGKFLYVGMPGSANPNHVIFAFRIDPATGALGPVVGSPFDAGSDPLYMALDPAGKFLYVSNIQDNTVSAFTISATTGVLTPVVGSPYAVPSVAGLTVEASGKFLYVSSANAIAGFSINSSTGALTSLGPSLAAGTSGLLTSVTIK